MEALGLAIGILALIKPTAEAISELWTSGQNFSGDASRIRLRFDVQLTRLKSFERVLFEPDKFPLVQGQLFDHLAPDLCENFVELLRQLYELLLQYYAVRKRYALEDDREGVASAGLITSAQGRAEIVSSGRAGDEKLAKAVSWVKKVRWVVGDKKSAEKLVLEFEEWTERVRSLLELVWWPLPFFSTATQMEKLERDPDAGQIGILEGIGMRKLLASPSLASSEAAKGLKISKLEFCMKSQFQDLEVGELTDNINVAVEYKNYEQDSTGSINEIVSRRILQLVALLHEAKDDRFRVLRCINFFDDVPLKRIGFVFQLPPSEAQMNLIPTSLNLNLLSKKTKPMLGARIKLAHTLAESIGLLHSVGWVHKSLRSENIIFFPIHEVGNESGDALLENPQIFGFEYSRVVTDFSSGRPDFNIRRNIYRHPARWGQPSETFSKIHDIYGMSLSLIL
jgi:hypothetical protein